MASLRVCTLPVPHTNSQAHQLYPLLANVAPPLGLDSSPHHIPSTSDASPVAPCSYHFP